MCIRIQYVYSYSVYISSFHSTQLYILIMVSRRHRNVDFIALTFITNNLLRAPKMAAHKTFFYVSF